MDQLIRNHVNHSSCMNVLYVEDEKDIASKFYKILKKTFSNTDMAFNGKDALDLYYTKQYDLVITDLAMPIMHGIKMIKTIKSINPKQEIIVTSAHSDKEYLQELINLHISHFIEKPMDLTNVLQTLNKTIQRIVEDKAFSNHISKLQNQLGDYEKTDFVTKLPNKKKFILEHQDFLQNLKEEKSLSAIVVLNINDFKNVNNSYGSEVGDLVLQTVAQRLTGACSYLAIIASLGMDSFIVALKNLSNKKHLIQMLEEMTSLIRIPITINNYTIYIDCNLGVSIYEDDAIDSEKLLNNAEIAMFFAKKETNSHYLFYNTRMHEITRSEALLDTYIHKAIELDEFVVYYQPQVDSRTTLIIGAEALVRWKHPELGLLSPAAFLPLAEKKGLLVEIDRLIMEKAFKATRAWYDMGLVFDSISVNLTAGHLLADDFIEVFAIMLEKAKCKPEWVYVEITEGTMMSNPSEAVNRLNRLKKLGVRVAIDDFGTGYSSLSHLKTFPVDKLKIDRMFIKGLPQNLEDASIINAIISLANSLKISTIAEGVETLEQKEYMTSLGNFDIQGYYYSPPVNALDFERLLKKKDFM